MKDQVLTDEKILRGYRSLYRFWVFLALSIICLVTAISVEIAGRSIFLPRLNECKATLTATTTEAVVKGETTLWLANELTGTYTKYGEEVQDHLNTMMLWMASNGVICMGLAFQFRKLRKVLLRSTSSSQSNVR